MHSIIVSRATSDDLADVVAMAKSFYESAGYDRLFDPFDMDNMRSFIGALIESNESCVVIARVDRKLAGMSIFCLMPVVLSPKTSMAYALAWWVDPGSRGAGVGSKLFDLAIQWAKDHAVKVLTMAAPKGSQQMAALYVKRGFHLMESTYAKRV